MAKGARAAPLHAYCVCMSLWQRCRTVVKGVNACGRGEARFLPVGTKEMMQQTDEMLAAIGYTMPQHALLLR
jgi:hypothetical protein